MPTPVVSTETSSQPLTRFTAQSLRARLGELRRLSIQAKFPGATLTLAAAVPKDTTIAQRLNLDLAAATQPMTLVYQGQLGNETGAVIGKVSDGVLVEDSGIWVAGCWPGWASSAPVDAQIPHPRSGRVPATATVPMQITVGVNFKVSP